LTAVREHQSTSQLPPLIEFSAPVGVYIAPFARNYVYDLNGQGKLHQPLDATSLSADKLGRMTHMDQIINYVVSSTPTPNGAGPRAKLFHSTISSPRAVYRRMDLYEFGEITCRLLTGKQ